MIRAAAFAIILFAFTLGLWAPHNAAAQSQEDPPLFGGIFVEAIPAAPTELTVVSVGDNVISLTWKDNSSDETEFQVWRGVFSGNLYLLTQVGPDVTSYTDSGLESNTTYSYMTRTCNNDGCSDSNIVSATTHEGDDFDVVVWCFIATAVYRDP